MDKQIVMVPIKEIERGRYNVLREKDRNYQSLIMRDIEKRGLENPVKVNREKGQKAFASIDGDYRIGAIETLHQKKKAIKCLQNGNWIPKGKVPAWTYALTPQEAYMEAARSHLNRDFETPTKGLRILEFGGHFDRALKDVKHGSKGITEQGIADAIGRKLDFVETCLSAWRNSSDKLKATIQGSQGSKWIKSSHIVHIARIKSPNIQAAAYHVAEKMGLSETVTQDLCEGLRVLEDNPLVAPLSQKEAENVAKRIVSKKSTIPVSAYFMDLMESRLLKPPFVNITIHGLKCPDCGRLRKYIHCQSRLLEKEELKGKPCKLRSTDIKMDDCIPDISVTARFVNEKDRDTFKAALETLESIMAQLEATAAA